MDARRKAPPDRTLPAERLRTALDLFGTGVDLMRQNLRRQHPEANVEDIERRLRDWISHRPGARRGDCPGRTVTRDPAST